MRSFFGLGADSAAAKAGGPRGALVLALGLDAFVDDPLQGMRLSPEAFTRIGAAVQGLGLPTVIVQEGGYLCDGLGGNLTRFFEGFCVQG